MPHLIPSIFAFSFYPPAFLLLGLILAWSDSIHPQASWWCPAWIHTGSWPEQTRQESRKEQHQINRDKFDTPWGMELVILSRDAEFRGQLNGQYAPSVVSVHASLPPPSSHAFVGIALDVVLLLRLVTPPGYPVVPILELSGCFIGVRTWWGGWWLWGWGERSSEDLNDCWFKICTANISTECQARGG